MAPDITDLMEQRRYSRQVNVLADALIYALNIPHGKTLVPFLAPAQARDNREARHLGARHHAGTGRGAVAAVHPGVAASTGKGPPCHPGGLLLMDIHLNCSTLSRLSGQRVCLPASVTSVGPVSRRDRPGTLTQVRLADYTGEAALLLDAQQTSRLPELHRHAALIAEIQVQQYTWGVGGMLMDWRAANDQENRAKLIPWSECPQAARSALSALVDIINGVSVRAIRCAINALVEIAGPGLVLAQASWHDHHAQPGGLLGHTVDVIQAACSECDHVFPGDVARRDVIALIAFVHDLAKSELNCDVPANRFAQSLGHKLGSCALAMPALRVMARAEPELGQLAGRMLEWLSRPASHRRIRECPEAELVQRADEFSVIANRTNVSALPFRSLEASA